MKDISTIIDDVSRKQISFFLPPLVRMREWKLLFTPKTDGVSMQTFYNNLKQRDNTLMLIRDECDRIFGAFCCEAWKISNKFYGTGESFVFSFEEDDINVNYFTGENDMA
jgi:hypothetical protein